MSGASFLSSTQASRRLDELTLTCANLLPLQRIMRWSSPTSGAMKA
jgi:hypothetical protein